VINAIAIVLLALWLFVAGIKNHDLQWSRARILFSRDYIKYSLASWPVPVVIFANIYASQIIIKQFAGDDILGVFLSANIFANIFAVVQGGFNTFWSGYMMANYNTDQERIKKVHDYVGIFVIITLCVLVASKELVYMVIGPKYSGSSAIFPMVMMGPLCNMMVETTAYGISIAKKAHHSLFSYSIYFILNNVIALILVPKFGMLGAGIAILSAAVVNFLMQTILGQRYYSSIQNPFRTFFAISVLILISIVNYIYRETWYISTGIAILIILAAIIVYWNSIKYLILIMKSRMILTEH